MNENLKKLLEQATMYAFDSRFVPEDNPRPVADVIQEKFAELIVGECIKTLADNSEFRGCVIIVKHFGIE